MNHNPCPHCGAEHDAAMPLAPGCMPLAGDASVCFDCGQPAVYAHDGLRRFPTPDEMAHLKKDFSFNYITTLVRSVS